MNLYFLNWKFLEQPLSLDITIHSVVKIMNLYFLNWKFLEQPLSLDITIHSVVYHNCGTSSVRKSEM